MRHAKMRRALIPTAFGSGTGYRVLENTMPVRNLLRNPAKLDQFRANGTIEGVHKVMVPVPGQPAVQRTLAPQSNDESLVIETVGPPPSPKLPGNTEFGWSQQEHSEAHKTCIPDDACISSN